MNLMDLLATDNWVCLNKTLAKKFGIENAIMIGLLASYQKSFGGEEFFREREKMIEDSCLTEYAVKKSLAELKEIGILDSTHKGMPYKVYYRLNDKKLLSLIGEGRPSRQVEINPYEQVEINPQHSNTNNINYRENNKKNNNKETLVDGETDQIQIMFEQFWKAYPRKVAKKTAFTAFKNIKHLKEEFPKMMQAVNYKKGTQDWLKDNGRFIPHPTTYIHQERWKDEEKTISANNDLLRSDNKLFGDNVRAMLKEMGL